MEHVDLANNVSLNHFMNSFLRDFNSDLRVKVDPSVQLFLEQGIIKIEFDKESLIGSHKFKNEILLNDSVISLNLLAQLIFKNFSSHPKGDFIGFAHKVIQSQKNIKNYLDFSKDISRDNSYFENTYLNSEQSMIYGHPFHPYSKLKMGMSEMDQQKYSPEFKCKFNLVWVCVPKTRFYSNFTVDQYKQMTKELIEFDSIEHTNQIVVPLHPWQWDNIKEKYSDIQIYKIGRAEFSPLSSMRTLYNEKSKYQLKYSLDIVLTNSKRHLQLNEITRGADLNEILLKEKLNIEESNLKIQAEPFFVGFKDDYGNVDTASFVQFRENTFVQDNDLNNYSLLSTLCEKGFEDINEAQKLEWFRHFLENVIKPFLDIYSQHGILLGAHLQNIIIKQVKGFPQSVIFRDCQGTGVTLFAFEKWRFKYKKLSIENGNVLNIEETNKVFGYYLIVNTVFLTITSLASNDQYYETQYLTFFRNFLIELRRTYKKTNGDFSFLSFLLESDHLYQKGNMRCCLNEENENTLKNPWDIYNKIPNPIKTLREITKLEKKKFYKVQSKSGKSLALRSLELNDLETFHRWHHKDFVSEFWELDKSKFELLEYMKSVIKCPGKLPIILEIDNEPAGYFEAYWAFEDRIAPYCHPDMYDRGIHLLFGEEKFLRSKIILESIYHVTKYLLEADSRTQRVWGEPRSDNQKILKIANKLPGWKSIKEFDFPHKRSMLLECEKKRFYEESYDF